MVARCSYAIVMSYPEPDTNGINMLSLTVPRPITGTKAVLLVAPPAAPIDLEWSAAREGAGVRVALPPPPRGSTTAWVIKFTGLGNA